MMKRLFATILAVLLCMSCLPAVWASEEAVEPIEELPEEAESEIAAESEPFADTELADEPGPVNESADVPFEEADSVLEPAPEIDEEEPSEKPETSEEPEPEPVEEQEPEASEEPAAEVSEELPEFDAASVYNFARNAQAPNPIQHEWDDAYAQAIRDSANSWGDVFQLLDIDMDGIPELLQGSRPGSGVFSSVEAAFTYRDGAAVPLTLPLNESGWVSAFLGNNYVLYRNTTDRTYRLEGSYTVRAGAGYYTNIIAVYSLSGDALNEADTWAVDTARENVTYFNLGTQLSGEDAYNAALNQWRSGWKKVEDYESVSAYYSKTPTNTEIRNFLASYKGKQCGDKLYWSYDEGTLTITGTGDMWDYSATNDVPWAKYRSSITNVEIDSRATGIGDRAFYGCTALTSGQWGEMDGLTRIGKEAFAGCTALDSFAFPEKIQSVGEKAFENCDGLETLYFFCKAPEFGEECFSVEDPDSARELAAWVPYGDASWTGSALPPSCNRTIRWARRKADDTAADRCFVEEEDAWGFLNDVLKLAWLNLSYNIHKEDYNRLISQLCATDVEMITVAETESGRKQKFYDLYEWPGLVWQVKTWGGSCYGMSDLAILIAQGEYTLDPAPPEITSPGTHVISAINFYHGQQWLTLSRLYRNNEIRNETQARKLEVVESHALAADAGCNPFIMEMHLPDGRAHTVVAYGIESGQWSYGGITYDKRILIYDCSQETASSGSSDSANLYYTTLDDGTFVYSIPVYGITDRSDGTGSGDVFSIAYERDHLNMVDFTTGEQSGGQYALERIWFEYIGDRTNISIDFDTHTVTINGTDYTTDNKNWERALVWSDADGEDGYIRAAIDLPRADVYTVTAAEDMDFRFVTEHCALTGVAGGGTMTVDAKNGGVAVTPNETGACYVRLTANEGHTPLSLPMVEARAEKAGELSAGITEKGVLIAGDDLTELTVTAGDFTSETELELSTDKGEVLLVTEDGTLIAYVDEDGDGVHETPIGRSSSVLLGDCNRDGKVNRQDRVYLARALAGWEGYETVNEAADVNGDGKVNRQDRVYLARALAGWDGYSLS